MGRGTPTSKSNLPQPFQIAKISFNRISSGVLTFRDFQTNTELLENEYPNVYEKRLFFCDKADGNIMTKRLIPFRV